MKKLLPGFMLVLALCLPVFAAKPFNLGEMRARMEQPIVLDKGINNDMRVVFNHKSHEAVNCRVCHHKTTSEKLTYTSCGSSPECHNVTGVKDTSDHSYFQATHKQDTHKEGTKASCYGCHAKVATQYDSMQGCLPCHKAALR